MWGWERAPLREAALAAGADAAFVPSTVVFDDARKEAVALTWELDAARCPLLRAGAAEGTLVCGAYDARPTVCRAFPVVLRKAGPGYSTKCPVSFAPAGPGPEGYAHAYGGSFQAAELAATLPRLAQRALEALERSGELRLARGLSREQVLTRMDAWPLVDLTDALARAGTARLAEFKAKVPALIRQETP